VHIEIDISIQMYPSLQEVNAPMFEGIEMECCDILYSVVQISFPYQGFSTVS